MRRKNRGIKLHDISGFVNRLLSECDPHFLDNMSETDWIDLRTRFAATMLHLNFKSRVFLPM